MNLNNLPFDQKMTALLFHSADVHFRLQPTHARMFDHHIGTHLGGVGS